MLEAMGIKTWAPLSPAANAPKAPPSNAVVQPPQTSPAGVQATAVPSRSPVQAAARAPAPVAAPAERPAPATPVVTAPLTGALPALLCHAPQRLYHPAADRPHKPAPGRAWLIVADGVSPQEPLGGDTGRLLDNMLRAMGLHQHPEVHLCVLAPRLPGTGNGDDPAQTSAGDPATALEAAVQQVQPDLVLLMGRTAARAALGRSEPLGRLRAETHHLAQRPALVTYDPGFLLRSPEQKASAWTDLCRALALAAAAEPS